MDLPTFIHMKKELQFWSKIKDICSLRLDKLGYSATCSSGGLVKRNLGVPPCQLPQAPLYLCTLVLPEGEFRGLSPKRPAAIAGLMQHNRSGLGSRGVIAHEERKLDLSVGNGDFASQ